MDRDEKHRIEHMLQSLEAPSRDLTKWEEDFVESVTDQFGERGELSERQVEILTKIYKEKS